MNWPKHLEESATNCRFEAEKNTSTLAFRGDDNGAKALQA